jgi:hypothetical protein
MRFWPPHIAGFHVRAHAGIETSAFWYLTIFGVIVAGLIGVRSRQRE